MKFILTLHLSIIGITSNFTHGQAAASTDYLNTEMMLSEGDSETALRRLRLLPAEQQTSVVAEMITKVKSISSGQSPAPAAAGSYVRVVAGILQQIGTDEQILAAFGNLSNFGHSEPDAAEVLASCKSDNGVRIIQKLAEKRIPDLKAAINPTNDVEKSRSNDVLIPFLFLIKHMEAATNPEGARAATQIRDKIAARYASENGRIFVALLDEEMAKARSRVNKYRINLEHIPSIVTSNKPKAIGASKPISTSLDQKPSQEGVNTGLTSKIVTVIVMLMVGATLTWLFVKKRSSSL